MSLDTHTTVNVDDPPRPFMGHTDRITAIEYSPDGRLIATASWDKSVRLWDPLTGHPLQKIDTPGKADSLAFHPTGRQLATICLDGCVLVWEVKEGRSGVLPWVLQDTVIKTKYETHTGSHLVQFSNDGQLLAAMTPLLIVLQDADTGQVAMHVARMRDGMQLISLLGFASNDRKVLFACQGEHRPVIGDLKDLYSSQGPTTTYSFDLATRQQTCINLSVDTSHPLWWLVGSYDGAMIAGGAPQGSQIWDANSGEVLRGPLRGHLLKTRTLCFSRDGEWLIDVSDANTIHVWDTATGHLVLGPLRHPPNLGATGVEQINFVTCSPLKDRIAYVDALTNVHVWDVHTQQIELSSSMPDKKQVQPLITPGRFAVDSVHWVPDGRHVVSSSLYDDYIRTWDAETGEQVREYFYPGGSCIALSPDGTLLAAGSACCFGSIMFFDTKTGNGHSYSLDGGSGRACHRVTFSPTGSTLAVLLDDAYDSNLCFVFDVLGDRKTVFVQHPSRVLDVAFSPDGVRFAYATASDGVLIRSITSMDVISRVSLPTSDSLDPIDFISFSPDGHRLLVRSNGLFVKDLQTDQTLLHLETIFSGDWGLFSPDGQSLLHCSKISYIQLVNAATADTIWRFDVSTPACCAFSPGGEKIAVGFQNGKIELYEATAGRMLLPKRERSLSEAGSPGDDPVNVAGDHRGPNRPGPSRRVLSLADADNDSLMNMPAAIRRSAPGGSHARQTPRKNSGGSLKDGPDGEPRRGLIARLTSRRNSDRPLSDEPSDGRHRMSRMFELVSVGRANLRVMAAGPSEQGHLRGRLRQEESDESSSSPSPPASAHHRVESPEANVGEERSCTPSSDGLKDVLCYCLCIPRCHRD
ncbi:WD40 repeat-like protein [Coniophora puteana RWD-64-598 SS2]|uniref:WD40 repeat-like protein n=1 Tax=Coniophora puteana (strain RWD-64-598) TaxID=741705 RepID=A0A5M3MDL0_CONPW|nr:WD40 repeat-like protein [Coniophora puteana RWD-64-598 SS2]EIW77349.1 WD40 repeat-like protein [Coniophora puteana RWD-64-598 SS2]